MAKQPHVLTRIIEHTLIEVCQECSEGNHNCAFNAQCTDNDLFRLGTFTCECKPNFGGNGTERCIPCDQASKEKNCNAKRSGCGGVLPDTFSKTNLLSCLNDFETDFDESNFQFTRMTIVGQRSGHQKNFFKAKNEDTFIFFDELYNKWRVGGGLTPTVDAGCNSIPVC